MNTPSVSPAFKPVWDELRLGRHISSHDGEIYSLLRQRGEEIHRTLALLGYTLKEHPRGFYYLAGDSEEFLNKKRLTKIVAFGMVLMEALNQRGDVEGWLFPSDGHRHAPESFPVFGTDRHRSLMDQLQIRDREGVAGVLREMERLGFVDEPQSGEFRFLEPFYRIMDACIEAQKLGAEGLAKNADEASKAAESEEGEE